MLCKEIPYGVPFLGEIQTSLHSPRDDLELHMALSASRRTGARFGSLRFSLNDLLFTIPKLIPSLVEGRYCL